MRCHTGQGWWRFINKAEGRVFRVLGIIFAYIVRILCPAELIDSCRVFGPGGSSLLLGTIERDS